MLVFIQTILHTFLQKCIDCHLFRRLIARSDSALVREAAAGVTMSPLVYVADVCRFSTSYVTATAAGPRGIVRFRPRMSMKEFKARGRSSATLCGKSTRRLHVCEDEPSGRLTFALVSILVLLHALADFSRVPPAAICTDAARELSSQ